MIIFLFGCLSIISKYESNEKYLIYKSSKIPESIFLVKKDKKDKIQAELTSPLLYKTKLIGTINEEKEKIIFKVEKISFFSNWPNGWTEGEITAYCEIVFKKSEENIKCENVEGVEFFEVISGKIRYFDRYFLDEEGLINVKNRFDRIMELIKFLKKQPFMPEFFGDLKLKTLYGPSMNECLIPFLFPEKSIKKTALYNETIKLNEILGKDEKEWILGSDILWNNKYTKKIFPENLAKIRNAGIMWRDYEEASGIIMGFYNLDYYLYSILKKEIFKKVK